MSNLDNNMTIEEREIYEKLVCLKEFEDRMTILGNIRPTQVKDKGLKGIVKKIVSKVIAWYMEPLLEQQKEFNQNILQKCIWLEQRFCEIERGEDCIKREISQLALLHGKEENIDI